MLKAENISYCIGDRLLLEEISFTAAPGSLTAIIGPNGAGKSTLIKILGGTVRPASGDIHWKSQKLNRYTTAEIARERAVMTQNLHLSGSYRTQDVVMMGRFPHYRHSPGPDDFRMVDLAMEWTDTESMTDRQYGSLSGGEQQRIQFSRVMAQVNQVVQNGDTNILLLDEPLNNLDIRHQYHLLELSSSFAARNNVVVAVLHDINLAARYADQVLVLKKGRQIAFGPSREVLNDQLLSHCFDMKVRVQPHPFLDCPSIYFID